MSEEFNFSKTASIWRNWALYIASYMNISISLQMEVLNNKNENRKRDGCVLGARGEHDTSRE